MREADRSICLASQHQPPAWHAGRGRGAYWGCAMRVDCEAKTCASRSVGLTPKRRSSSIQRTPTNLISLRRWPAVPKTIWPSQTLRRCAPESPRRFPLPSHTLLEQHLPAASAVIANRDWRKRCLSRPGVGAQLSRTQPGQAAWSGSGRTPLPAPPPSCRSDHRQ